MNWKFWEYGKEKSLQLPASAITESVQMIGSIEINKFADFHSYLGAVSKNCWAAFRACNLIGNVVITTDFQVIDDKNEPVVLTGNNLAPNAATLRDIMKKPNAFDTWEEMLYLTVFHLEATGNCYWLMDEINLNGRPSELWVLNPAFVSIEPDPETKIKCYVYKINNKHIKFLPSRIIHFKKPNPNSSLMGLGNIEAGESLYNRHINSNILKEEFISNGATPSGVLIKETAVGNEVEWKKFKKKFSEEYTGKKNIGKVAFLNGKWKWLKMGMDSSEMQEVEGDRENINQIFANHGIPLSIAMIDKATNYATAKQDDVNFRSMTCLPIIELIVRRLNHSFMPLFDARWKMDYSLSGLVNIEQLTAEYAPLVSAGALTPNQLREQLGLGRVEDNPAMDVYYFGANMVPVEMAGLANVTDGEIKKIVSRSRINSQ
jgi:HK97 family phage portal protein